MYFKSTIKIDQLEQRTHISSHPTQRTTYSSAFTTTNAKKKLWSWPTSWNNKVHYRENVAQRVHWGFPTSNSSSYTTRVLYEKLVEQRSPTRSLNIIEDTVHYSYGDHISGSKTQDKYKIRWIVLKILISKNNLNFFKWVFIIFLYFDMKIS